jgi:CheY-like chemotaxis protein
MKMLVVEDNPHDAVLLRTALKRNCMKEPVAVVDGAPAAMNYLLGRNGYEERKKFPLPELILLDWKLRGMEGWEFLEWLRAQSNYGSLPVTVMSGSDDVSEMQKAYNYGANFWVGKPSTMKEFVNIIERIHNFWMNIENKSPDPALNPCLFEEIS